jgi:filamentous hemagglutinin
VQLLEAAAKALRSNPNASGTLRIFTERPPCASCRRVMARFLAEHPNIKLEVFHNARHLPEVIGMGAGVAAGNE